MGSMVRPAEGVAEDAPNSTDEVAVPAAVRLNVSVTLIEVHPALTVVAAPELDATRPVAADEFRIVDGLPVQSQANDLPDSAAMAKVNDSGEPNEFSVSRPVTVNVRLSELPVMLEPSSVSNP